MSDIVEDLRALASVETSQLYSQRRKLNAAADEIERLRVMCRDRDGGSHDEDCRLMMQHANRPCRCGHEEVENYFAALNGKEG